MKQRGGAESFAPLFSGGSPVSFSEFAGDICEAI